LFKGKQLWDGQNACPVLGWKMARQVRIMGGVVGTKQQKMGERRSTFFGGKWLYTLEKPCIIGERKTTRHGQNGADLVV
ncbi:hypothetical protein T11_11304, partial [Trichinella zimbabwensis]